MPELELKTYDDLKKYVSAFRQKNMGLLIIVSRAGLGKSYLVESELEVEDPLTLNSHVTPLRFYQLLYNKTKEEKDCLIIIDEAEMMFSNPKLKTMLKLLCDTRTVKTIRYDTTSSLLKKGEYEQSFETGAKVIMLINTLAPKDEHIKAIMSRGHLVKFEPPDIEVINYLLSWEKIEKKKIDKEIIKFMQTFTPGNSFNLRTYVKAEESKISGLDWEAEILSEIGLDQRLLIMRRILNKYKSEPDRIKAWEQQTGNERATYFRFKKLLLKR